MVESLRNGWPIIAGSAPVRRLVEEVTGQTCPVVACAVDGATFRIDVPIDADSRRWIGFPARGEWSKRTSDAVKALALLQSWREERLNVWCFGRFASDALPNWVEHHVFPEDIELRRLYNRSAVFLVPSAWEGFGLPGAEAMACGAALVSTRNDGVDAYATHGESAPSGGLDGLRRSAHGIVPEELYVHAHNPSPPRRVGGGGQGLVSPMR